MIVKGSLKWVVAAAMATSPLVASAQKDDHGHVKGPAVTVYKSPTCGCCTKWVDHLRKHGFQVTAKDTEDMNAIKASLGVPRNLTSCHTAVVGKYVIEGHVPAEDITRLLAEKPKVVGLAVPGMPAGSPGMETGRVDRYDVIAFREGLKSSVFAAH